MPIRLTKSATDALAAGNRPPESEASFMASVLDYAKLRGWRRAHFRPAQKKNGGWITAVQGDGAGFPDLVLVRGHRVIYAELKSERGKLSDEQARWIADLEAADQAVFVWRPSDWADVERILR